MLHYTYHDTPCPHIYLPELLPPERYQALRFPTLNPRAQGRIGRDLFSGEPEYETVIQSEGWRELHQLFSSREFVAWVLAIFANDLRRFHCAVDPQQMQVVPCTETREQFATQSQALAGLHEVNHLFTRFDFQAADVTYRPYVHLDYPRRLTGGLLFFADAEEEGLEGGEFSLYRDRLFANDRTCRWPQRVCSYPFRHNSGVIFLNCNTGFHGPSPIRALGGLRKWVYYSISSHQPVWPCPKPQGLARAKVEAYNTLRWAKRRIMARP